MITSAPRAGRLPSNTRVRSWLLSSSSSRARLRCRVVTRNGAPGAGPPAAGPPAAGPPAAGPAGGGVRGGPRTARVHGRVQRGPAEQFPDERRGDPVGADHRGQRGGPADLQPALVKAGAGGAGRPRPAAAAAPCGRSGPGGPRAPPPARPLARGEQERHAGVRAEAVHLVQQPGQLRVPAHRLARPGQQLHILDHDHRWLQRPGDRAGRPRWPAATRRTAPRRCSPGAG